MVERRGEGDTRWRVVLLGLRRRADLVRALRLQVRHTKRHASETLAVKLNKKHRRAIPLLMMRRRTRCLLSQVIGRASEAMSAVNFFCHWEGFGLPGDP